MDDDRTADLLRTLLERIRTQATAALSALDRSEETRAAQWECSHCGHRKHFTKPVTVEATAGSPCPKCAGTSYQPVITARR
jgi:Zn finger protein HypA/HybF involved in hydrogenase expression